MIKDEFDEMVEVGNRIATALQRISHGDTSGPMGLEGLAMSIAGEEPWSRGGLAAAHREGLSEVASAILEGLSEVATSIDGLARTLSKT